LNAFLRAYCYLRGKILDERRIDLLFTGLFLGQIILTGCFVYWQPLELRINVIATMIIALLTTALVYSNLSQKPESRLIGFLVQPKDQNDLVCKNEYIEKVAVSPCAPLRDQVKHVPSKYFPVLKKIVKCDRKPTFLEIRNDISNLGSSPTQVHEYQFEQIHPIKRCAPKQVFREILECQLRKTVGVTFPTNFLPWDPTQNLKDGLFAFKVTVWGANKKCSKRVWIRLSNNLLTLEWCESRFHGWKS